MCMRVKGGVGGVLISGRKQAQGVSHLQNLIDLPVILYYIRKKSMVSFCSRNVTFPYL